MSNRSWRPADHHSWITGTVVKGYQRGRTLGFPTANIVLDDLSLRPHESIYACWAQLLPNERRYQGALHVGPRPTFNDARQTIELHLLDFPDRDLYGTRIAFMPMQRLRGVACFATVDELRAAIAADCEAVRKVLT